LRDTLPHYTRRQLDFFFIEAQRREHVARTDRIEDVRFAMRGGELREVVGELRELN